MKQIISVFLLFVLLISLFSDEQVHILKEGETPYSLSRKYNIPYEKIMKYNGITDPTSLPVGMQIKIPAEESALFNYTVKRNDSLWRIAIEYGTTVENLKTLNSLKSDNLLTGQILKVPGTEKDRIESQKPILVPRKIPVSTTDKESKDLFWPVEGSIEELKDSRLKGVQIISSDNAEVHSVASGRVVLVQYFLNKGIFVFVNSLDNDGYLYCYGGLKTVTLEKGDKIEPGTLIGFLEINKTANKAICFFTIMQNQVWIDPETAPRI